MKILSYVRGLAPTYERKEVTAVLAQLRDELRDETLPVAREAQEAFSGQTLKSTYMKEVSQALRRRVTFQGSALDVLVVSLERLDGNLDVLEREVKSAFSFRFATANITYARANLLRYLEAALFYIRFFRKFLLRAVAEEAKAEGSATPMSWSKAERIWLDTALKEFVNLYPAIAKNERDLRQTLKETSDAEINEDTHEVAKTSMGRRLDPMQLENFSPTRNPVFTLLRYRAEVQVKRFKASQEESTALHLRLQELRELRDGGDVSPKLQSLITSTEDRIEKLDYNIAKFEEENQIDDSKYY